MKFALIDSFGNKRLPAILKLTLFLLCPLLSLAQEPVLRIPGIPERESVYYKMGSLDVRQILLLAEPMVQSNTDSALFLLHNALQLSKAEHLLYEETKTLGLIAVCYLRKGDYVKSQYFLDLAFKHTVTLQDKNMEIFLNNVNATIFKQRGSYAKSIKHYLRALDLLQEGDDADRSMQTYINFGGLWSLLDENKQALAYYLKAKKYTQKGKKTDPYLLMNIGIAYFDSSENAALQNFHEALQSASSNKDVYLMHKLYINLCNGYVIQKKYDSALFYLYKAEEAGKLLGTNVALALTQYHAGDLYYEMKDYKKAEDHLLFGLKLAEQTGLANITKDMHIALRKLYAAQGKFEKALQHQLWAAEYWDSLYLHEKSKTVDLMLDYQAAEKDRIIEKKQFELTLKEGLVKEKNIWLVSISGGTLLLCFISLMAYRNNKNKQRLQNEKLQNLAQQQEIEKLKALADGEERERNRIAHELHDSVMIGFATVKMQLNALPEQLPVLRDTESYGLILKQLDRAASELRRTAHNLMPDILLEEGIVPAIFYFCKNIQETSGLSVAFQQIGIPLPRFHMEFEIIIYRIVQELLQNVIKHAQATKAIVQINHSQGFISLTVEDNGVGFNTEHTFRGLGLKSISNRIKIINGTFDIKSHIGKGTTIYIECAISSLLLLK